MVQTQHKIVQHEHNMVQPWHKMVLALTLIRSNPSAKKYNLSTKWYNPSAKWYGPGIDDSFVIGANQDADFQPQHTRILGSDGVLSNVRLGFSLSLDQTRAARGSMFASQAPVTRAAVRDGAVSTRLA